MCLLWMTEMIMSEDPYVVLGVDRNASFADIRMRYFQLARKHHPDKLQHIPEEERKTHEAYFQKVTAAYQELENRKNRGTGTGSEAGNGRWRPDDWRSVWARVEAVFQRPDVWQSVKQRVRKALHETVADVVSDVASKVSNDCARSNTDGGEETNVPNDEPVGDAGYEIQHHYIRVPVTMEDICQNVPKKLQLFLQGVKEPVRLRMPCGHYPKHDVEVDIEGKRIVHCTMEIQDHSVYRQHGWGMNLETTVSLTWEQHLTGCNIELPDLGVDGGVGVFTVRIPPGMGLYNGIYWTEDTEMVVPGRGLMGRGDLYVRTKIVAPDGGAFDRLSAKEQEELRKLLNALYAADSGLEKS